MAFKSNPKAEKRKCSAIALIKHLLLERKPEVLPTHYKQLLTILLWKITEAESTKYRTRFQSGGAQTCGDKAKLRHDHVFQREKMIAELMKAAPEEIDGILKKAVACTVTEEEHNRLREYDGEYGWERYRRAGIRVFNTETDEQMNWIATDSK